MLDKRLSACMSLVSGDVACDVGTDHGYLPAELLTSGKCRFCYACDINENPLRSAEKPGIFRLKSRAIADIINRSDLSYQNFLQVGSMI